METVLVNLILQGWPETVAIIVFSLSLLGKEFKLKTTLFYGFLLAALAWLLRILPIPLGVHTLITFLGLVLILHVLAKASFAKGFCVTLIGLFVLGCAETLVHFVYEHFFGAVTYGDGWLWILIGWPQIIILFVLASCNLGKKRLFNNKRSYM